MTLLLALATPALALVASKDMAPCGSLMIGSTSPASGAVDVPLDAQPTLILSDGGCATDTSFTAQLLLLDGDAESLVHEERFTALAEPFTHVVTLELTEDLEAERDYVLRVEADDGFGGLVEVGFSTGEGLTEALVGEPEISSATLTWGRERRQRWSTLEVDAMGAEDPHELGVVILRDVDEDEVLGARALGDGRRALFSMSRGGDKDDVCLELAQLDARGEEAAVSEVVCTDAERAGCSATGRGAGGGSLALAFAAMLGLILRRRP